MDRFEPAKIAIGDEFRVKSGFNASGVNVPAGIVVRVMGVNEYVEERVYQLTINLLQIHPPGGSILWGRSHPLDQRTLDEFLERIGGQAGNT
jgi:hypothetical protein